MELSDALKRYLTGRTNQAAAYLTHFEQADYARWGGACLGQAHLWMKLDAANPAAAATDRLDALASFDGAVHATLHQRSYSHEREEGFSIARMLGVDPWSAKPGTHDAVYTRAMNDLHGIGSHVHSHSGLRLAELPQAMCEINGYAIAEVDLPGRRGQRHAWGLSRTTPDEVKIFDSNYGEFRVPAAELPAFLSHMNEQINADLGAPIDRVSLRPMTVEPRYEGTPAADLCRWLESAPSHRPDHDRQDASPWPPEPSGGNAAPSTLTRRPRMRRPDGA